MQKNRTTTALSTAAVLALVAIVLGPAHRAEAVITGPYTADSDTLHLWHIDEADPGPASPAAGVTGSFDLDPVNGATLGNASFAGFGSAGDTSGTGAGDNDGLRGALVDISTMTGADGAFTMEALINTSSITDKQGIIMMDAPGGTGGRPFQFAIRGDQNLLFIDIANGVQNLAVPIPTTGDDAFVAGEWFHVSAAYNGSENTPDNFKLFWTRMDDSRTEANEVFSGTLVSDLAGGDAVFGVGQEFRSPSENLLGLIDEVRISSVARGAGDYMFAPVVPEPATATLGLLALGGLGALTRRRRA